MIKERYWFVLAMVGLLLLVIFGHADPNDYYNWSEALP